MESLLLDTDVLINWLRGEKWEKTLFMSSGINFYYSIVSRKELFQYKKIKKKEQKKINYLLNCFREIRITPAIAEKASIFINCYKSHHLKPHDAIIAATAWDKKLVFATKNQKHFTFIKEIKLYPLTSLLDHVTLVQELKNREKQDDGKRISRDKLNW